MAAKNYMKQNRDRIFSSPDSSSGDDLGIIWLQCEIEKCKKWRKLDKIFYEQNFSNENLRFDCSMNPDKEFAKCNLSEEKWIREVYKYNQIFPLYTLVLVKRSGHPIWPAIITLCPKNGKYTNKKNSIYHIEFLGKPRFHKWVDAYKMTEFTTNSKMKMRRNNKLYSKLQEAYNEGLSLINLIDEERKLNLKYIKNESSSQTKLNADTKGLSLNITHTEEMQPSNSNEETHKYFKDFTELNQYGKSLLKEMNSLIEKMNNS